MLLGRNEAPTQRKARRAGTIEGDLDDRLAVTQAHAEGLPCASVDDLLDRRCADCAWSGVQVVKQLRHPLADGADFLAASGQARVNFLARTNTGKGFAIARDEQGLVRGHPTLASSKRAVGCALRPSDDRGLGGSCLVEKSQRGKSHESYLQAIRAGVLMTP